MNKKLLTLTAAAVLSVSVLFGATGLCADKVEDNTKPEGAEITFEDNEYTFDIFKEELKDDISKADLQKAKILFEKATKLDQDACKAWNELYAMDIFKYDQSIDEDEESQEFTFDLFRQELKDNLSKDLLKKAETLFNKAIALEQEDKFEEADKVWNEIYSMDIFKIDVDSEAAYAEYTFDEFKKELKENVSEEELSKAKALFEKAMSLEQNNEFNEAKSIWEELYEMNIFKNEMASCGTEASEYTFDMFKEELKDNVSKDDLGKAKALFDKATALDQKAISAWDELYGMDIFKYFEGFSYDFLDDYTFEQFKDELKPDISKKDLTKAQSLFEKAMEFEKKGDFEKAQLAWDELYSMDIFEYVTADSISTAQSK